MTVKMNSQQTGTVRLAALLLGSWLLSSCATVQAQADQTVVNGGLWSVPVSAEVLTQAAQGNPLRYQDRRPAAQRARQTGRARGGGGDRRSGEGGDAHEVWRAGRRVAPRSPHLRQ